MTFKDYLRLHTTLSKGSQCTYLSAVKNPANRVHSSAMGYYTRFLKFEQASLQGAKSPKKDDGKSKTEQLPISLPSYLQKRLCRSSKRTLESSLVQILALDMDDKILLHLIMAYCQERINEQN